MSNTSGGMLAGLIGSLLAVVDEAVPAPGTPADGAAAIEDAVDAGDSGASASTGRQCACSNAPDIGARLLAGTCRAPRRARPSARTAIAPSAAGATTTAARMIDAILNRDLLRQASMVPMAMMASRAPREPQKTMPASAVRATNQPRARRQPWCATP